MYTNEYCPNCSIGLNNQEIRMRFCQNCKHHWEEKDLQAKCLLCREPLEECDCEGAKGEYSEE